jgi:uncharacterized metal-binding protein
MPSGKTHDVITAILAVPAFAATYAATRSIAISAVMAVAFVFGGLMFGPDLDTVSRQYSRWLIFRFIWFPYRRFLKHRSRFSHGLLFGALGRVIYFMGVLTLAAFTIGCVHAVYYSGGKLPGVIEFSRGWQSIGQFTRTNFGEHFLLVLFVGLWLGAASHTFTDFAGSFIKTGRAGKFL